MVTLKTALYALKQLKLISEEQKDFTPHLKSGEYGIFIQFSSGKNLSLSDEEVKYQAIEFLNSEIQEVKHG